MNNDPTINLEIYLDYATIPSLNYFLHFIENYQDKETIRLFGLSRFSIPQHVINDFPPGVVNYEEIKLHEFEHFYQKLENIIQQADKQINMRFHLNLFHSIPLFGPINLLIKQYANKISGVYLNLYDDGAEGFVSLYDIANINNIDAFIATTSAEFINRFQHDEKCDFKFISRYLWNTIYPSTYYLIAPEILEKPEMESFKHVLGDYKKLDLMRYANFSAEQKDIMKDILKIPNDLMNLLKDFGVHNKVFVFTGTTLFDIDDDTHNNLEDLHVLSFNHYIQPNGKYFIGSGYVPFVKGHPHSERINARLKNLFPDIPHLPAHIPLEVLYMLGLKIDKLGGFVGTSYLNLPKEIIVDTIFLIERNSNLQDVEYAKYMQLRLMEIIEQLGYLPASKLHFYTDVWA